MIAERLTAQLLAGPPARDPVAVAERLLACRPGPQRRASCHPRANHGPERRRRRSRAHGGRSILITWLNRVTLHLVRSEDYPWLHAVTTPPLHTATARRLAKEGVSPDSAERAVAAIERSLRRRGTAHPRTAEGADRRERGPHRGSGAGPHTCARLHSRADRARPDGRSRAGLRAGRATGCGRPAGDRS